MGAENFQLVKKLDQRIDIPRPLERKTSDRSKIWTGELTHLDHGSEKLLTGQKSAGYVATKMETVVKRSTEEMREHNFFVPTHDAIDSVNVVPGDLFTL